ncbi:MAG TPA: hypothetical protein V6C52_14960 [Coleofasciculaceae cyanobacterium]|jgi:hypothetical protein
MNMPITRINPFPSLGPQGFTLQGQDTRLYALPFFQTVVNSNLLSTPVTGLKPAQRKKLDNLTRSALQRLMGGNLVEALPFLQKSATILDRQLKRLIQQGLALNTLRAAVYKNIANVYFQPNPAESTQALVESYRAASLNYTLQDKAPRR